MNLNFKAWAESIFGRGILDEPEPSSEIPMMINKIQNQAFPSFNPKDEDPLMAAIKKHLKHRRPRRTI